MFGTAEQNEENCNVIDITITVATLAPKFNCIRERCTLKVMMTKVRESTKLDVRY